MKQFGNTQITSGSVTQDSNKLISWVQRECSAWDFTAASFTKDGAAHDLDLSSYVPAGTKLVEIRVQIRNNGSDTFFGFRKKGTGDYDFRGGVPNVANKILEFNLLVPCDSNRVIQYIFGKSVTWDTVNT